MADTRGARRFDFAQRRAAAASALGWVACSSPARAGVALLLSALLWCSSLHAEPLLFGSRSLEVPSPPGYLPVSKRLPEYTALSAAYLEPGNRLVEAYLAPDDIARLESGENHPVQRYFQLQTLRSLDGIPVSATEFLDVAKITDAQMTAAAMVQGGPEFTERGNAAARKQSGVDPKFEVSGVLPLGIFRREPWSLFFSIRLQLSANGQRMTGVCSTAFALINHQLVYLYANSFADENGPQGRAWSERAVSDWADALHAANPDNPAIAAQASPQHESALNTAIVGGLIGALVGVFMSWWKKRQAAGK